MCLSCETQEHIYNIHNNMVTIAKAHEIGLWSNGHLNMTKTVKELAISASRALSALYSKCLLALNDVKCFSETLRVTS